MTHQPPHYLALEGLDGCGKDTQLSLLSSAFQKARILYTITREPGGTEAGKEIRHILLSGGKEKLDGLTEAFLYSADRHENIRQIVQPALARGEWVLTSRSFLSTYTITQAGRGIDIAILQTLTSLAIGDYTPHLTLILDISADEALRRKHAQTQTPDRFEREDTAFHTRIRQAYLAYAAANPTTTVVIDGQGTVGQVHQTILTACNQAFGLTLQPTV